MEKQYLWTCKLPSSSEPRLVSAANWPSAWRKPAGPSGWPEGGKKMQSTYVSALSQLSRMEHIPVLFTDIRPGFVATEILGPEHHYLLVMPVGKAAEHILKGLRRRRRVITFDWKFRIVVGLWRLIPRALWERITFIRTR